MSPFRAFSDQEKAVFQVYLDEFYTDFTSLVENDRNLKVEIDSVAQGRVFSAYRAKEIGLIDEVSSLSQIWHNINRKSSSPLYLREYSAANQSFSLIGGLNVNQSLKTLLQMNVENNWQILMWLPWIDEI
jgi:ClpP class serine protease